MLAFVSGKAPGAKSVAHSAAFASRTAAMHACVLSNVRNVRKSSFFCSPMT